MRYCFLFILFHFPLCFYAQSATIIDSLVVNAYKYYENGDYKNAILLYKQAADQDNAEAQFYMGLMYESGMGTDSCIQIAREWYAKSASQGYPAAQNNLAVIYLNEKKDVEALQLLENAAAEGHTMAQFNLACLYDEGKIVIQNPSQALALYRKAAEGNLAIAQRAMGNIYSNKLLGVALSYQTAFSWYEKAAENGDAFAQSRLGYYYMLALGCTQDFEKAYYWSSWAAEQGNTDAQNNLGYIYMEGLGREEKDFSQALFWFHKAAEQEHATAQYNIGYMFENGLGVNTNIDSAYVWYKKAADNGYRQAENNMKLLRGQIAQENGTYLPVVADKCIALVIGNADYQKAPLKNPLNDAEDIVRKFKAQGIETIPCYNGKTDDIRRSVKTFCEEARRYDAALFYYSGHGVQKDGINYLVPVNAKANTDEDQYVSINDILSQMNQSGVKKKIVILDACRTYEPIENGGKGGFGKGLADMANTTGIPTGTYILYAASTNQTANDGTGRNSPFTSAMLKMIDKPNSEIRQLFYNVRKEVMMLTNKEQIPSANDNLVDEFFFNIKNKK